MLNKIKQSDLQKMRPSCKCACVFFFLDHVFFSLRFDCVALLRGKWELVYKQICKIQKNNNNNEVNGFYCPQELVIEFTGMEDVVGLEVKHPPVTAKLRNRLRLQIMRAKRSTWIQQFMWLAQKMVIIS